MPSWDAELEAFLCSCGSSLPQEPFNIDSSSTHPSSIFHSPSLTTSDTLYSPFSPALSPHTTQYSTDFFDFSRNPPPMLPSQAPSSNAATCMWAGCKAQFRTLADLVGHVNLDHLRLAALPQQQLPSPAADSSLSCQWNNCNDYPTTQSIPGSSSSTSFEDALGVLSEHLFQDHLGVQPPFSPLSPPTGCAPSLTSSSSLASDTTHEASSASDEIENAVCRWRGCGLTFGSTEELTTHITSVHVGAGRARYECHWQDCSRNEDKGFSSKQKICRHLQVRSPLPRSYFSRRRLSCMT
jgi:hypothetical protein